MAKLDPKNLHSEISSHLSAKALKEHEEEYKHDLIYVEPSTKEKREMQEKEELQAKIEAERAKEAQRRQKEEKLKKESEGSKKSESGSDDGSGTSEKNGDNIEEEEYEDNEEDYLFRVYFKDDEIEQAMEMQKIDHFDELLDLKQEATAEASINLVDNKINISEFIPKQTRSAHVQMRMSRRGGIRNDLEGVDEEEHEDDQFIEDALQLQQKMSGKKVDKEIQQKMHQYQMHSLDAEISELINAKLHDSPRSTGSAGMKKRASSKKKKR